MRNSHSAPRRGLEVSRWVLVVFALSTASACGARSLGENPPDDFERLRASDAGVDEDVVPVLEDTDVRPNSTNQPTPDDPSNPIPPTPINPTPTATPDRPAPSPPETPSNAPPDATMEPDVPMPDDSVPPTPTTVPSPEPTSTINPPVPPDMPPIAEPPSEPPIWAYINSAVPRVVNLNGEGQTIESLPTVDLGGSAGKPWSNNGQRLVTLSGRTLSLRDLSTSEPDSVELTVGTETMLFGWMGDYGPLFRYYYEGELLLFLTDRNGNATVLAADDGASAVRASSSPAGNGFLYSTAVDGEGAVFWVGLDGEIVQPPVQVYRGEEDLMRHVVWSNNGSRVAFSQTSPTQALLFDTTTLEPPTPIGAFTSDLRLSPDGDHFLNFENGSIVLGTISDAEVSFTVVDANSMTTPARFSLFGQFLYFGSGSDGALRGVNGMQLHRIPGFAHDCPLDWFSATEFLYRQCASGGSYSQGTVIDNGITYQDTGGDLLDSLSIGAGLQCFVSWQGSELHVGRSSTQVKEFTRRGSGPITHATISPASRNVAWVENTTTIRWLTLTPNCQVTRQPIATDLDANIDGLHLITP